MTADPEFSITPVDRLAQLILLDELTQASPRERDELLERLHREGFEGLEHGAVDEPAARRVSRPADVAAQPPAEPALSVH